MRSHYGEKAVNDRKKLYYAGNTVAAWLGIVGGSWMDIAVMQSREQRADLERRLREAA